MMLNTLSGFPIMRQFIYAVLPVIQFFGGATFASIPLEKVDLS